MTSLVRLKAARLFDGVEMFDRPMVVEIAAGKIVRTLPWTAFGTPGFRDMGDLTLIPGLVDAHVHLAFPAADVAGYGLPADPEEVSGRIAANARRALESGITAVRDLGDPHFAVARVAASARYGLAIAASGPPLTKPRGHCHFMGGAVSNAQAIAESVGRWAGSGVHIIKVMCTGGVGTPGSDPLRSQFSDEELRILVDSAHSHGLQVTAHAHGAEGVAAAVRAGVDGLEHAKFWSESGIEPDEKVIETIADRGIWVCPTLGEMPGQPPPPPPVARRAAAAADVVRKMWRAGVRLIAGSDAGISAGKPHNVLPYSIEAMSACGMGALDALRAATSHACDACGFSAKGRLRPGFDADMIAVRGNPIDDLSALRRVSTVWVAGHEIVSEDA